MDMQALMPNSPTRHPSKTSEERSRKPCCKGISKSESWVAGTLNTEYRNEFIDKEVPVLRASWKYEGPPSPAGKFDSSTTYGGDYKPFHSERVGYIIPPSSQQLSGATFQGSSAYSQQFGAKLAVPFMLAKGPAGQLAVEGDFCSSTTYGGAYTQRGVPQPARSVLPVCNIKKEGEFQGQSMYKSTFTQMPSALRVAVVPLGSGEVLPSGTFQGTTNYSASFSPKGTAAHVQQFKPKDARPMSSGQKYDLTYATEYNKQFLDKEISAPQCLRPSQHSDVLPRGELQAGTTYGGDFQAQAAARVLPTKPRDAVQREEHPFVGSSSYAASFEPKAVAYHKVKPVHSFVPSKDPTESYTSQRAAYQAYAAVPRVKGGPQVGGITREALPFEGTSAYKSDFTKMPGAAREGIQMAANEFMPVGPFVANTTYSNDFYQKEIGKRERPGPHSKCCDDC